MNQRLYSGTDKHALSLLEIFLALSILMLAVIPLYRHMTTDASITLETEKIQMADKILESIKEEIHAMPFSEFYNRTRDLPNPDGPFELSDGYYPITLDRVLQFQMKVKDFKVVGTWSYVLRDGKLDKTMVQVDAKTCWSQPGKTWERNKSFLIIQP